MALVLLNVLSDVNVKKAPGRSPGHPAASFSSDSVF